MHAQIIVSVLLCSRPLNSAMNPDIEITAESVYDVLRQPPASLARLLPGVFEKLLQPAKQTHRFMEVYTVRPVSLHPEQIHVTPFV